MEDKDYLTNINSELLIEALDLYKEAKHYKEDVVEQGKMRFSFMLDGIPYIVIFNLHDGHIDYLDSVCSCGEKECVHRYIASLLYCQGERESDDNYKKATSELGHLIDLLTPEEKSDVLKALYIDGEIDYNTLKNYIAIVRSGTKREADDSMFIAKSMRDIERVCDTVFNKVFTNMDLFYVLETGIPEIIYLFSPFSTELRTSDQFIIRDLSFRSTKKVLEFISRYMKTLSECYQPLLLNILFCALEANPETFELISPMIHNNFNSTSYLKEHKKEALLLEIERARVNGDIHYEEVLMKL